MRIQSFVNALVAAAITLTCSAQVVELPSLSIEGSALTATVTYDAARAVYRYDYRVSAPQTNKVAIDGFCIDILGRLNRAQYDPTLTNSVVRREATKSPRQPLNTIPVGLLLDNPTAYSASVNAEGSACFMSRYSAGHLQPGNTAGGFALESKFPPGARSAEILPTKLSWIEATIGSPEGTEFYPQSDTHFDVQTTVLAPTDPDMDALFDGGGQSPREVNVFLRYASPVESRTKLPAGTTSATVVVFYGSSVSSSTFRAELNGIVITDRFHPIGGAAEAVTIELATGTTRLQLSADGTTSSGRTAKDTDTLTFLVASP